jgi:Tol biopolymer transport system component
MNCYHSRVLSIAVTATTIVFCSVFFGCSSNHTDAQREVLRTVRSSETGNRWLLLLHERDIVSLNVSDSALQHLYPEPGSSVRPSYLGMASLNPAGDKIVFSESPDLLSYSLTIFDLRTHKRESLSELPYIQGPRWAPDGSQIAFEGKTDHTARNGSLYLYDLSKRAYSIIIEEDLKNGDLLFCWAPDGRKIVYQSGDNKIRVFDVDSRLTRTLDSGGSPDMVAEWSIYRVSGQF